MFSFLKITVFISGDQQGHFIFKASQILSVLQVGESHNIFSLSSWHALATNLALTFNLPLTYFLLRTQRKMINLISMLSTVSDVLCFSFYLIIPF